MGMGAGVWFNSEASFRPNNVASTEMIDRKTPNSELCMANGYSSMVFDQRIFVSFNPCAPTSHWSRLLLKIDQGHSMLSTGLATGCKRLQRTCLNCVGSLKSPVVATTQAESRHDALYCPGSMCTSRSQR
jgi:Protein of unknown function (DUF3172)